MAKKFIVGVSQWNKPTPARVDNAWHLYLLAYSMFMNISMWEFIHMPSKAVLWAAGINSLVLPFIYGFCRCFGLAVPDDIPQEHSVTPASPAIQSVVDKIDDASNEAAKIVPDLSKWLVGLTQCKDLTEIAAYLEKVPAEIISNPHFTMALTNMNAAVIHKELKDIPASNPLLP